MSKYLNKSLEELERELQLIEQAKRHKEQQRFEALGGLFARILDNTDNPQHVNFLLEMIQTYATKAEKKTLKSTISKLQSSLIPHSSTAIQSSVTTQDTSPSVSNHPSISVSKPHIKPMG